MLRKLGPFVALCAIALISQAVSSAAEFEGIQQGADWLVTQTGTFFVIGGVNVPLMGVPDPLFNGADTIIQRLSDLNVPDVAGSTATTNLHMLELQLQSTAPVNIGGSFFDVFVNLNPAIPTTGTLTLTQTVSGEGIPEGTFTSFFDVFFTLTFKQGGVTVPCPIGATAPNCNLELTLTGSGQWTDDVPGVWLVGSVTESHPGSGVHMARQIPTAPEPASGLVFATGLAGVVALVNRKRRR
jgi:hypothetical protein